MIDTTAPLRPFFEHEELKPQKDTKELLDTLLDGALFLSLHLNSDTITMRGFRKFLKVRRKRTRSRGVANVMIIECLKRDDITMLIEFSTRFAYYVGFDPFHGAPVNRQTVLNCKASVKKEFG